MSKVMNKLAPLLTRLNSGFPQPCIPSCPLNKGPLLGLGCRTPWQICEYHHTFIKASEKMLITPLGDWQAVCLGANYPVLSKFPIRKREGDCRFSRWRVKELMRAYKVFIIKNGTGTSRMWITVFVILNTLLFVGGWGKRRAGTDIDMPLPLFDSRQRCCCSFPRLLIGLR